MKIKLTVVFSLVLCSAILFGNVQNAFSQLGPESMEQYQLLHQKAWADNCLTENGITHAFNNTNNITINVPASLIEYISNGRV